MTNEELQAWLAQLDLCTNFDALRATRVRFAELNADPYSYSKQVFDACERAKWASLFVAAGPKEASDEYRRQAERYG